VRLSTSMGKESSGLGLAIVHSAAQRLGARLEITNTRPGLRVELTFSSESRNYGAGLAAIPTEGADVSLIACRGSPSCYHPCASWRFGSVHLPLHCGHSLASLTGSLKPTLGSSRKRNLERHHGDARTVVRGRARAALLR
jgi:hypothetical protein